MGQEEFGWEIFTLNGSVFAGDTRCGRGGLGPVYPSAGLREQEGRVLLLSPLRGPRVTDEMMDLNALVKCKLRNLACKTLWLLLLLLLLLLMCQ